MSLDRYAADFGLPGQQTTTTEKDANDDDCKTKPSTTTAGVDKAAPTPLLDETAAGNGNNDAWNRCRFRCAICREVGFKSVLEMRR